MSEDRLDFLAFEIQHIFVTELSGRAENTPGAILLRSIGFDLDARSNQIALLFNPATRDALRNAPANVQQALAAAGLGWNIQNSKINPDAHPEYNRFNIEALNDNIRTHLVMEQAA